MISKEPLTSKVLFCFFSSKGPLDLKKVKKRWFWIVLCLLGAVSLKTFNKYKHYNQSVFLLDPDEPVRTNPRELPKKLTWYRLVCNCNYNVIMKMEGNVWQTCPVVSSSCKLWCLILLKEPSTGGQYALWLETVFACEHEWLFYA